MLTIVDRPALQYVVDEAREAGIEHFVFVTGRNKGVIADHFDIAYELEATLAERGKTEAIDAAAQRPAEGRARSPSPASRRRSASATRSGARASIVGREPFAVLLPDMLMSPGCLEQMLTAYEKHGGNVIAVEEVPRGPGEPLRHRRRRRRGRDRLPDHQHGGEAEARGRAVEPRSSPAATSCSRRFSTCSATRQPGAGGEIQITDAMKRLSETQRFTGFRYRGRTYDTGTKAGFLIANVAYALARADIGPEFRAELTELLGDEGS